MIKFLVDENIGQSIIHYLKEQGYDVVVATVTELSESVASSVSWQRSLVQAFLIEAFAIILVPSTKRVLPSIRSSFRHNRTHSFSTLAKAVRFFLLKRAMVLWSGFKLPVSQMNDRL